MISGKVAGRVLRMRRSKGRISCRAWIPLASDAQKLVEQEWGFVAPV
jgi:hypothetical protein